MIMEMLCIHWVLSSLESQCMSPVMLPCDEGGDGNAEAVEEAGPEDEDAEDEDEDDEDEDDEEPADAEPADPLATSCPDEDEDEDDWQIAASCR
jgi:hypothetical protein